MSGVGSPVRPRDREFSPIAVTYVVVHIVAAFFAHVCVVICLAVIHAVERVEAAVGRSHAEVAKAEVP